MRLRPPLEALLRSGAVIRMAALESVIFRLTPINENFAKIPSRVRKNIGAQFESVENHWEIVIILLLRD
jgi:hypothetical protein